MAFINMHSTDSLKGLFQSAFPSAVWYTSIAPDRDIIPSTLIFFTLAAAFSHQHISSITFHEFLSIHHKLHKLYVIHPLIPTLYFSISIPILHLLIIVNPFERFVSRRRRRRDCCRG